LGREGKINYFIRIVENNMKKEGKLSYIKKSFIILTVKILIAF